MIKKGKNELKRQNISYSFELIKKLVLIFLFELLPFDFSKFPIKQNRAYHWHSYEHIINEDFTGATRAEILLFHDTFNSKYSDKENCRNASAGIVRRKDSKGAEDLTLISYDAIAIDEKEHFSTEISKLK